MKKIKNPYSKLFFIIICSIILFGTSNQIWEEYDIVKNKGTTTGVIKKYEEGPRKHDRIIFEYIVNNQKYINGVSVHKNTDKRIKDDLNRELTIYYSKKNPEYSIIDLGKYDDYRSKVYFYYFIDFFASDDRNNGVFERGKTLVTDPVTLNVNSGIRCKSFTSRIIQRENGQKVLILAIRDLDQRFISNDEVINKLKDRLRLEYPSFYDYINEVVFEFYYDKNGYRSTTISCQDVYN